MHHKARERLVLCIQFGYLIRKQSVLCLENTIRSINVLIDRRVYYFVTLFFYSVKTKPITFWIHNEETRTP